jgi:hypothetical protein
VVLPASWGGVGRNRANRANRASMLCDGASRFHLEHKRAQHSQVFSILSSLQTSYSSSDIPFYLYISSGGSDLQGEKKFFSIWRLHVHFDERWMTQHHEHFSASSSIWKKLLCSECHRLKDEPPESIFLVCRSLTL